MEEPIKVGDSVYERVSGEKWKIERINDNFCKASRGCSLNTYKEQSFPLGVFTRERPLLAVHKTSKLTVPKLKRERERQTPKDKVAALLLEVESHKANWKSDPVICRVIVLLGKDIEAVVGKTGHLNPGQKRMWLGNQVRSAIKDVRVSYPQLEKAVRGNDS